MPMDDTIPEDLTNGTHVAKKVPGAQSFNVYDENAQNVGYMWSDGEKRWWARAYDLTGHVIEVEDPAGPYESADDAFADTWGVF